MEDKKLTPQESMELIASMIQRTKRRVASPDLRISVMWAALTIITAAAAWILLSTTHNPWFNFVWFAIPVIGIPTNIILANSRQKRVVQRLILTRSVKVYGNALVILP